MSLLVYLSHLILGKILDNKKEAVGKQPLNKYLDDEPPKTYHFFCYQMITSAGDGSLPDHSPRMDYETGYRAQL